jgi:hypothetical protein
MLSILSRHTCWLPRTSTLVQRIWSRSTFSVTSNNDSHTSISHRSESRFALKIARFQFSKDRIQSSASLSTHAHYTKTETQGDIHELARSFVLSLEPGLHFVTCITSIDIQHDVFRSSTNSIRSARSSGKNFVDNKQCHSYPFVTISRSLS